MNMKRIYKTITINKNFKFIFQNIENNFSLLKDKKIYAKKRKNSIELFYKTADIDQMDILPSSKPGDNFTNKLINNRYMILFLRPYQENITILEYYAVVITKTEKILTYSIMLPILLFLIWSGLLTFNLSKLFFYVLGIVFSFFVVFGTILINRKPDYDETNIYDSIYTHVMQIFEETHNNTGDG